MGDQRLIIADVSRLIGAAAYVGDFFMSKQDEVIHCDRGCCGAVADDFIVVKVCRIPVDSDEGTVLVF